MRLDPAAALLLWALACAAATYPGAADKAVWLFELLFGIAAVAALFATRRHLRFSDLAYLLAALHFAVLAVGARYTYALAPPGEWLRDAFGLARNHFDRVGHFMQGFVPAVFAREVLLRRTPLRRGAVLTILVVAVPLAFSALYEIVEWLWIAVFYPSGGLEWLGVQGDVFDTQADMLMALLGASSSLLLARLHDRSIRAVEVSA